MSVHYVAGETEHKDVLRVASAIALVWHDRARNIYRQPPLDFAYGKNAEPLAVAAPKDADRVYSPRGSSTIRATGIGPIITADPCV